jgi:hypothetical protein
MSVDEVDSVLTGELGLLVDASERGNAKTYFFKRICWQPSESTRIARVAFKTDQSVASIRLCVSSDNNNSVFVEMPLKRENLKAKVVAEMEALQKMQSEFLIEVAPFNALLPTAACDAGELER